MQQMNLSQSLENVFLQIEKKCICPHIKLSNCICASEISERHKCWIHTDFLQTYPSGYIHGRREIYSFTEKQRECFLYSNLCPLV